MILSDIQAECGRLLGDANNTRWTAAVLTTRANLAQTEIQGYTQAVKTGASADINANVRSYQLDASTMNVLQVQITDAGGSTKPYDGMNLEELNFRYPDWKQLSAGPPVTWYYDATLRYLFLIPTPDYTYLSGLQILESRKPADLVASTDIPFDSNNQMIPYHIAIVHWVVAQCFMDDGTPEALTKAKFHKSGSMLRPGEYEKQLGRIMAEFDVSEDVPSHVLYKPQGGRVGSWMFPSKSNPLPW